MEAGDGRLGCFAERIEYCFYEDPTLDLHRLPMRPTPIVDLVKIQTTTLIELHGENFSLDLRVFFGELPAVTRQVPLLGMRTSNGAADAWPALGHAVRQVPLRRADPLRRAEPAPRHG